MTSKPKSYPNLTRLLLPVELQSQGVNLATNNTAMKDHAGTSNNEAYYTGRTSFQQTTAYLHQGAGSQWQNDSSCIYYTSLNTPQQNSFMQTRTPLPPNGHQVNCNQGNFYQDSRFLNSHPPQSSLHNSKAEYVQQNVPSQRKRQGANNWQQYNVPVPKCRVKTLNSSNNRMSAKPTTTTSPPYQQRVNTGQCESSLTHNNQIFYNHGIRETNTQQPPSYYHKHHYYVSQSQQPSRNYYAQNMPVQEGMHVSYMGQGIYPYPTQLSPTFRSKQDNTQSDKNKTISAIIDYVKSYCPVNQDVCSTANNSSLYRGVQSSVTPQAMPVNTSNTRQYSVFLPGEPLDYIPGTSPTQDMAGSSPETPHVFNGPVIDQNKSVGEELRNSPSPREQSTEEDCTVNLGHTTLKAIAVVQPLSQESCQVSSKDFDAKSAATGPCESSQEVSEKPDCSQELGSRLAGKTLTDQHDAQMSQPPDVPRSQSCESGDNPEASISESSSGPTASLTFKELHSLIETGETPEGKCSNLVDGRNKLQILFMKNFSTNKAQNEVCRLITESKQFVKKHVTLDTKLLKLEPGAENQHCYILGDNDLYIEPPFKSLWLNTDGQLDDIDKEFGFAPCLRFTHRQKMDNQVDLVSVASVTPGQTDSEVPEKDLKQAEPKLVESEAESSPIRAASPDHTQDGDSPDPCCSFQIQVLPPEEAKLIYEQRDSPEQHAPVENQDSDRQTERDACSSVVGDVPDFSVALFNETESPLEVVCCLSKLVKNILEIKQPLVRCQCSSKKSVQAIIDLTESDSNDSVTEIMDVSRKSPREKMVVIENKKDNNPSSTDDAFLYPKIDGVYSCADSESIQSVISTACDSNIENPSSSDTEISSLISKGEDMKFSDISSDSSEETKEETPVATKTAPLPDVESKTESSPEPRALFQLLKRSSWCKLDNEAESQPSTGPEVSMELPRREHLDSNSKAVQLVLYGSVPSSGKTHKRKRFLSTLRPPEVLSVPLWSVKRQLSEPLPAQEQSVKTKIFEIWSKSFPAKSLKRRGRKSQGSARSLRTQEKKAGSPERKKRKLLDSNQRPVETKRISPGEL